MRHPSIRRRFSRIQFFVICCLLIAVTKLFYGIGSPVVEAQTSTTSNFGSPAAFSVGTGAFAPISGDFNRDGKLDLVTANTNNFSLLLGTGNGGFAPAVNFGTGFPPQTAVTGDFNGDGKLDLIAAQINAGSLAVFLGDGAGGFAAPSSMLVNAEPFALAAGDFNGDGKLDLAAANFNENNISMLLGNGAGGFSMPVSFNTGNAPDSIKTVDVNKDGRLDLVTANFKSNNVSVLLGDGNGGFGGAMNFETGNAPGSLVFGDFNGDGKVDLATANILSDNISVLFGSGNGEFGAAANFAAGVAPLSLAAGDYNGDGKIDLVTIANDTVQTVGNTTQSTGNFSVLYGRGGGSFDPPVNFAVGQNPGTVISADFNGDGQPDLAADVEGSQISVIINNTVAVAPSFSINPANQQTAAAGGNLTVNVTSSVAGSTWTAISNANWITVTNGSSGTGNGTVALAVQPNTGIERTGTVAIAGQTLTVNQAAGCAYALSSSGTSLTLNGGNGSFNITADSGCGWTVSSSSDWLTIYSNMTGSGSGTIFFLVQSNTGAARTGIILIAGQTFTVNQAGTAPEYEGDLSPRTGGNGYIDSDDVQQIRRFSVGLDRPYLSSEFQRADVSPRYNLGDGFVDANDVEQARRYAVGIDAKNFKAGPTVPLPTTESGISGLNSGESKSPSQLIADLFRSSLNITPETGRAVRVASQTTRAGQTVTVPINVDTSGDETNYTFSLSYDSSKLKNPVVSIGELSGDVVYNTSTAGEIGFSVTYFNGANGSISGVTNKTLVNVTFTVAANVLPGDVNLNLTDTLVRRQVAGVDPDQSLPQPVFTNGTLNIVGPTAAAVSVSGRVLTQTGRGIKNVMIALTDSAGNTRIILTGSFGYYRFNEVRLGDTYTITARAKRFSFMQNTIVQSVTEDRSDLNFIAIQ